MDITINYWAVLVSGVAAMVIGFLWYGPVFGKVWVGLMGWTPEKMEEMKKKGGMGMAYGAQFVAALVMGYVLGHFAAVWKAHTATDAFQLALWPWLGFIVTTMLGQILWEGKPAKLYVLNIAHYLVTMYAMALIIVYWPW